MKSKFLNKKLVVIALSCVMVIAVVLGMIFTIAPKTVCAEEEPGCYYVEETKTLTIIADENVQQITGIGDYLETEHLIVRGRYNYEWGDDFKDPYAFFRDTLRTVTIEGEEVTIESHVFEGCSVLETVTIGGNDIIIDNNAFFNCSALKIVTIGEGVSGIDFLAFGECFTDSLEEKTLIQFKGTVGRNGSGIHEQAFDGVGSAEDCIPEIIFPESWTDNKLDEDGHFKSGNFILHTHDFSSGTCICGEEEQHSGAYEAFMELSKDLSDYACKRCITPRGSSAIPYADFLQALDAITNCTKEYFTNSCTKNEDSFDRGIYHAYVGENEVRIRVNDDYRYYKVEFVPFHSYEYYDHLPELLEMSAEDLESLINTPEAERTEDILEILALVEMRYAPDCMACEMVRDPKDVYNTWLIGKYNGGDKSKLVYVAPAGEAKIENEEAFLAKLAQVWDGESKYKAEVDDTSVTFTFTDGENETVLSVMAKEEPAHIHDDIEYQAWTESTLPTTAGYYYLANDITLTANWTVPEGETYLCLNGKILTMVGYLIQVPANATLNLVDCGEDVHEGNINKYCWSLGEGAEGSTPKDIEGGIIYIPGDKRSINVYGTFNMFGGTITGFNGGNIHLIFNDFIINSENKPIDYAGNFNMYGGAITGNNYTNGFYYINHDSSFGVVDANKFETFTVGKDAVIDENYILGYELVEGSFVPVCFDGNVILSASKVIKIATGEYAPTANMKIGVKTKNIPTRNKPIVFTDKNAQAYLSNFESNMPDMHIEVRNKNALFLCPTDVVEYVPHDCVDNKVEVNGQSATCTEDGWKNYYQCNVCETLYSDDTMETEIEDLDAWIVGDGKIEKTGHSWTFTANGNTLTATCEHDSTHTSTLTLSATNETFSGDANYRYGNVYNFETMSYSCNATWSNTSYGFSSATLEYYINETTKTTMQNSGANGEGFAPRNAGNYIVKATVEINGTQYTISTTFTVEKAIISKTAFQDIATPVAGATAQTTARVPMQTMYNGELVWSPALKDGKFDYCTTYTATVTLSATNNYKFANDTTYVSGWTKSTNSTDSTLILTKTYTATSHNFGEVSYIWNGNSCTATRVCANNTEHKLTETKTATYVKDTNVTCTTNEKGHYEVTFEDTQFGSTATEQNSVEVGEPLNHNYSAPTYEWSADHTTCTATRVCANDNTHKLTETKQATYVKDADATCVTTEKGHYTVTFDDSQFGSASISYSQEIACLSAHDIETIECFRNMLGVDGNVAKYVVKWIANGSFDEQFPLNFYYDEGIGAYAFTEDFEAENIEEATAYAYLLYQALNYSFDYAFQNCEVPIDAIRVILDKVVEHREEITNLLDAIDAGDLEGDIDNLGANDCLIENYKWVIKMLAEAFGDENITDFYMSLHNDFLQKSQTVKVYKDYSFDYNTILKNLDKALFNIGGFDVDDVDDFYAEWLDDEDVDAFFENIFSVECESEFDVDARKMIVYAINTHLTKFNVCFNNKNCTIVEFKGFLAEFGSLLYKMIDLMDAISANDDPNTIVLSAEVYEDSTNLFDKIFGEVEELNIDVEEAYNEKIATMKAYNSAEITGHNYGAPTYVWDGDTCTATRTCSHDASHKLTETKKGTYFKDTNATCTTNEKGHYEVTFEDTQFGSTATEQNSVEVGEPLNHNYGTATYTWSEDHLTCTARMVCSHDSSHVISEVATLNPDEDAMIVQYRGCTLDELTKYTARFTNTAFETQNVTIKTNDKYGHNYFTTYSWSSDNTSCTATRECTHNSKHVETETATATSTIVQYKNCTDDEYTTYTARFTNSAFATQTKFGVKTADKLGHNYGTPTYTWSADNTTCTAKRVCANDNTHILTESKQATYVKDTNATCTTNEKGHYEVTFEDTQFGSTATLLNSHEVENTAINHNYGEVSYTWNGATCTATRTCSHDASHKLTETKKGTYVKDTNATCTTNEKGHYEVTFEDTQFGSTTTLPNSYEVENTAHHSFEETFTVDVESTLEHEGSKSKHCANCDEKTDITAIAKKVPSIVTDDEEKTVKVETEGGLDTNVDLVVEVVVKATVQAEGKELSVDYSKVLNKKETLLQVYDVKLLLDGVEVQPSEIKEGMVLTVKMLLPKDLTKNYRVIHVHNANDITELKQGTEAGIGTYIIDEDGYLVTKIDKLSEFAFANVKSYAFPWWIILIIVICVATGMIIYYKTNKKNKDEKSKKQA